MLTSTANETLAEASYDELWGTGKPFFHKECTTQSKWTSTGILGEMLMEIRAKLRPNTPSNNAVSETSPVVPEEMDPS